MTTVNEIVSPSTSNEGNANNLKLEFNALIRLIPKFNSESRELYSFLTGCEDALGLAAEDQKGYIFKYIKVQITGNARKILENKIVENWSELKTHLLSLYKESNNTLGLYRALINAKQNKYTVRQYEQYMETLSRKLGSDAKDSTQTPEQLQFIHDYIENKVILNIFINGLNPELCSYVNNCHPKTLSEAANFAQHEEARLLNLKKYNRSDFSNRNLMSINTGQVKCNICKRVGHTDSQCYFRNKNEKKNRVNHNNNEEKDNVITCFKCKKTGHIAKNCNNTENKNFRQ